MKHQKPKRRDTPGRKIFDRPLIRFVKPIENPNAGLMRFLQGTEPPRKPKSQLFKQDA